MRTPKFNITKMLWFKILSYWNNFIHIHLNNMIYCMLLFIIKTIRLESPSEITDSIGETQWTKITYTLLDLFTKLYMAGWLPVCQPAPSTGMKNKLLTPELSKIWSLMGSVWSIMAPHGKELPENFRNQIVTLHKIGKKIYNSISKLLSIRQNPVAAVIRKYQKSHTNRNQNRSGHPQSTRSVICEILWWKTDSPVLPV